MRKKWILIALAVGLLAAAITGGVALAWGGPGWGGGHGWNHNRHAEQNTALAAKVAATLGTDAQATADALTQARQELRQEAQDAYIQDFAGRVAATLGTDAQATADALTQVSNQMRTEALETKLQTAIENGDITEERAQEIRDQAASGQWRHKGIGLKSESDAQEFANRVGAILNTDADATANAIQQAITGMNRDALETKLQAAVESGHLTEEKADTIRQNFEENGWRSHGKRGHGRHGRHAR